MNILEIAKKHALHVEYTDEVQFQCVKDIEAFAAEIREQTLEQAASRLLDGREYIAACAIKRLQDEVKP